MGVEEGKNQSRSREEETQEFDDYDGDDLVAETHNVTNRMEQ